MRKIHDGRDVEVESAGVVDEDCRYEALQGPRWQKLVEHQDNFAGQRELKDIRIQ